MFEKRLAEEIVEVRKRNTSRLGRNALKLFHLLLKIRVLADSLPQRGIKVVKDDLVGPVHLAHTLFANFAVRAR